MKNGLRLAFRVLLPFSSIVGPALACSSTEDAPAKGPVPPPSGGTSATAGSAGNLGGSLASSSGGASGTAGTMPAASCVKTADCTTQGAICKASACSCPSDVPTVCGASPEAACVAVLADPGNCGSCGAHCDDGASCVAGQCGQKPTELLKAEGCGSMRLALTGGSLYWTESSSGKVRSMPVAGGPVAELASGQTAPSMIVADDKAAYWINQADVAGMSKLMKKLLAAGPAVAPVALKTATVAVPDKISAIAVGGGKLFYTLGHDVHAISTDETSTAGDTVVGTAINKDVSPPVESGEPAGLALRGKDIVWTTANRQGVERDDIDAGTAGYVELGQSQGGLLLSDIALDATYAYWANGQSFVRNELAAAAPIPDGAILVTPSFDNDITAFAINATHVYAATATGQVVKHSLIPQADPNDDSTAVPAVDLARDQAAPTSVVLDATHVYWATKDCAIRATPL